MERDLKNLSETIRTKEELVFFLEEIAKKKLNLGKEQFSGLEKKLRSLTEMKLEIAFSPDNDFLNRISQWLEKELGQKVILDITVNQKVVAGAIIEYRGNWRDFSSAKKIDQLFTDKLTNL
ncbi:MAG TPA: F0F1 ATP synthase subunit delta [Candidatus Humimicrobiaceae bacterium]|nr:F0F1 ATP synthase subunit delta [Candidatus Humimicrobiaceae bacterium]